MILGVACFSSYDLVKLCRGATKTSQQVQGGGAQGQRWDTYQEPGPAWGMNWDIRVPVLKEEPVRGCVSVCVKCGIHVLFVCLWVCVKCSIHVFFVCGCVWCETAADLVVCPMIRLC